MLRIAVAEHKRSQTIKLERKIVGPFVEQLSPTWHSTEPLLGSEELHLESRRVALVASNGCQLLREIDEPRSSNRFASDAVFRQ